MSLFGGEDVKTRVSKLTRKIDSLRSTRNKDDSLKAALLRKELEAFLYKQIREFRDNPDIAPAEKKRMFIETQKNLKLEYLTENVGPFFREAGIDMPLLKQEGFLEELADKLWLGYIGRFVSEKRGSKRAFTGGNLDLAAKLGILTFNIRKSNLGLRSGC